MSELNYQIWDTKDIFNIEQAVYLWQDQEPPSYRWLCDECLKNKASIHPIVAYGSETGRAIAELIEKHIDMSDRLNVSREELIEVANKVGMKPKFLFPEMQVSDKNLDEKVHPKKRNSYLKIIKGLLKKQGINPSERGHIDALMGMVTDAGQSLKKDAIGDILKEVAGLIED